MARRGAAHAQQENLWRMVWMLDPFMLNRIELILLHGRDFFPDSSESAILEAQMKGLVSGAPLKSLKVMGELVTPAQAAIEQLFEMRDAGQMGEQNVGSNPAHRGEHPARRHRGRGVGQPSIA